MKVKNKLLIFVITFLVLLIFSTSSFASFDFDYNSIEYSFTDLPTDLGEYYAIVDDGNGYYSIFYGETAITYDNDGRNLLYSENIKRYLMNGTNGTWSNATSGIYSGGKGDHAYQVGTVIYSSHNIYYKNDSETIFFQKAPIVQEYQMTVITTVTQLPEIVVGVTKVIIPVCLAILSMVLVIYLIKSVTSRMG